jgi:hypothetical protein
MTKYSLCVGWLVVGDNFLKSEFTVNITSNTSVEGFRSRVRNKITMLQYEYSLLAIFPSFSMGNFLVLLNDFRKNYSACKQKFTYVEK